MKAVLAISRFQPGEGPGRGLLRDCTTSPINRFASLVVTFAALAAGPVPLRPRQPAGPLPLPQDDQHGRPGALELPVGAAAGQQLQTRGSVSRP